MGIQLNLAVIDYESWFLPRDPETANGSNQLIKRLRSSMNLFLKEITVIDLSSLNFVRLL